MYKIVKPLRNHVEGSLVDGKEFDEASLKFLVEEKIVEEVKQKKKPNKEDK